MGPEGKRQFFALTQTNTCFGTESTQPQKFTPYMLVQLRGLLDGVNIVNPNVFLLSRLDFSRARPSL